MHALDRERALSAHDIFKEQYTCTLRWSVLGALAALVIAVLVLPEYRPTPYRLDQHETQLVEIELAAPPVDMPPPREIPRPVDVVSAPDDDPDVEDYPDIPILLPVEPVGPRWVDPVPDTPFVPAAEKPRLLRGAVADYPEIARLAGMQGTVVVKVQVDVDGSVARAEILKGVHALLDKPALAAARKLRFSPGTQQGTPVRCWVAVPFRFYLH